MSVHRHHSWTDIKPPIDVLCLLYLYNYYVAVRTIVLSRHGGLASMLIGHLFLNPLVMPVLRSLKIH